MSSVVVSLGSQTSHCNDQLILYEFHSTISFECTYDNYLDFMSARKCQAGGLTEDHGKWNWS